MLGFVCPGCLWFSKLGFLLFKLGFCFHMLGFCKIGLHRPTLGPTFGLGAKSQRFRAHGQPQLVNQPCQRLARFSLTSTQRSRRTGLIALNQQIQYFVGVDIFATLVKDSES